MHAPVKIRIAPRRSQLALTQTRWVASELRRFRPGLEVEEIHVVTEGDRVTDKPLYQIGGKGLFVSEVEAYVARGEARPAFKRAFDAQHAVFVAASATSA